MSLLDTIAPKRGPNQRRFGKLFAAKTSFYVAVFLGAIFVLVAYILYDNDRVLDEIPATRVESEIFQPVYDYLQVTNVHAYGDPSTQLNCGTEFADAEFKAEYLNRGSWRVNAWYNKVRYYWRVDDLTLEVTRDPWLKTNIATIEC
jgi:hypothetical protein